MTTTTTTTRSEIASIRADLVVFKQLITSTEARLGDARTRVEEKTVLVARMKHAAIVQDIGQSISQRMRAVFHLRTLGDDAAAAALFPALKNHKQGTLLRHEVAFCLGQMQLPSAQSTLIEILLRDDDDPIVRHEAAEALGAINDPETSVSVLKRVAGDARTPIEVRETCEIALEKLTRGTSTFNDRFDTVDPTPAHNEKASVKELGDALMNPSSSLYERYRAMFSLRNRGDEECVKALTQGFHDTTSALFRHEIAYVLGQLAHPASVDSLERVVKNDKEHEMVRHEAAEAMGAIGDARCMAVLAQFQSGESTPVIVKESCVVAIDAADYWRDFGTV